MTIIRGLAIDGVATIDTDRRDPAAVCHGCDWHRDPAPGPSWLAVRAAARRHVAATGHRVSVAVTTLYQYGRPRRSAL